MGKRVSWALAVALAAGHAVAATGEPVLTIELNGGAGGKRFDGIGVVDGGGATSVLLKDYPEPQRSEILDLVYKPKYGASVSALYVEIPGDGNSTQGSMPSHMHTRDDLDYSRGYTWWLLTEARKRHPGLSLDGTAWSAPGWIGDSGMIFDGTRGDRRFFSQDTIDYYLSWLKGLRANYGLEMDALGMRNEKGVSYDMVKALRRNLDANGFSNIKLHAFDNWPDEWKFEFVPDLERDAGLRDAVDVIGAHINSDKSVVPAAVQQASDRLGKPLWNTEGHVYKAGYEGLISIVESFNENFIRSGVTRITNWYGIASVYTMAPYSGEKEAAVRANWPWSGHYAPNPSLWGYAHYGQFTEIGWSYLNGGSGDLPAGGTYVTLKSPGADYSVIVETKEAKAPQRLSIKVGAGLATGALAVWRSNAHQFFERQADLTPVAGMVTLTLDPGSVYSLTTTRGQQKGGASRIPARGAFPFPYRETFDQYEEPERWGYLPRYFADIAGAFELSDCPARQGKCLRQMAPAPTISWAPDWKPYTVLGDDGWTDYEVSAEVYISAGESAAVMGRVNDVGGGYGFLPKGYYLQLDDAGELRLVVARGKVDKKALIGDSEQQALIKAQKDRAEGGEKVLATAHLGDGAANRWHTLKLQFKGETIRGYVDGKALISVSDSLYGRGMAGLLAGPKRDGLSMPYYDNVIVNSIDGALPPESKALPGQTPIYRQK